MSPPAAFSLAIVCEGPDDLRTAPSLADRVVVEEVDWVEPQGLAQFRSWRGFAESDSHLPWDRITALAKQHKIRAHGRFDGVPAELEGRRALLLLAAAHRCPDAAVLVRDTEGDLQVRSGLDLARREPLPGRAWPFPVVLGVAHTKRECWVLAGFEPRGSHEEEALSRLRDELKFDPRISGERLTGPAGALHNAKRVHSALGLRDDRDREEACWMGTDLSVLADRGRNTGLADFLQEVRERLVPLFGRPTPERD